MSLFSFVPPLLVGVPFVTALGLIPVKHWRTGARINLAASAVVLALACLLPVAPMEMGLNADRLAMHFAMLTAVVGCGAAWYSAGAVATDIALRQAVVADSERVLDLPRMRLYHVLFQAFLGGALLAVLADNPVVTWLAVEFATLVGAVAVGLSRSAEALEASWKSFMLCGIGVAVALFGTVVLALASQQGAEPVLSWAGLPHAALSMRGATLNLAFVFLLTGYGMVAALVPMHGWMADAYAEGPTPLSAVLSGALLNAALLVIVRMNAVLAANHAAGGGAVDPADILMGMGILTLLPTAFGVWRRRDVKRFFAYSTIQQNGLVVFAIGLGALPAALLHVTLHTLAKAALFQCVGMAAQQKGGQRFTQMTGLIIGPKAGALGAATGAAILALIGLPPFGLFSSTLMIVAETAQRHPWLCLPVGLGSMIGAWALVVRLHSLLLGTPSPDPGPRPTTWEMVPVWLQLGLVVGLGVLMPDVFARWLQSLVP